MLRLAAALSLVVLPAAAAVTPDDLRDEWSDGTPPDMASGTAAVDGDALVLEDVEITLAEGLVLATDRARLVPDGDATRIDPSDTLILRLSRSDAAPIEATITAPDAVIRATGSPGDVAYAFDAPTLVLDLPAIPSQGLAATTASFEALGATYAPAGAGPLAVDLEARAGTIRTGSETPQTTELTAVSVAFEAAEGALSAIAEGQETPGPVRLDAEAETLVQTVTRPADGGTETATLTASPARATYRIADGRLTYDTAFDAVALSLATPSLPTGLDARADRMSTRADLPSRAPDAPAPFDAALTIEGVTVSETVWDLVDPGGALPRDPGRIAARIEGEALVRPGAVAALGATAQRRGAQAPIAPRRLTLTDLDISGVGVSVTGEGTLTFPYAEGARIPPPEGTITLTGQGIGGLLNTLSEIGAIDGGQALGARLAIGMFATSGEGDTLTADLQFEPDGAVRIGGMQIITLPE